MFSCDLSIVEKLQGVVLDPIYGIKLASPPEIYQTPNLIQPGQFFNNTNKLKILSKFPLEAFKDN